MASLLSKSLEMWGKHPNVPGGEGSHVSPKEHAALNFQNLPTGDYHWTFFSARLQTSEMR
jgi:hypothetical protein